MFVFEVKRAYKLVDEQGSLKVGDAEMQLTGAKNQVME